MKKVLILSTSPRKGGNSDTLCDQFMAGATESGHQVEKIFLADKDVNYCVGCGLCLKKKGSCSQKDDMLEIAQKMVGADVIVMATPVYFYTMSAQTKTLIDRCCAYYPDMKGKEFYFIITAAEDDIAVMQTTVDGLRAFTHFLPDSKEKGIIYGIGAFGRGEIKALPAMDEAYAMGKRA